MDKKKLCFVGILFVAIFAYAFVHEFAHIALNGFRVDEFCVLNCPLVENPGIFGNHYAPVAVRLSVPINPLAKDENLAFAAGTIVFSLIVFAAAVRMREARGVLDG